MHAHGDVKADMTRRTIAVKLAEKPRCAHATVGGASEPLKDAERAAGVAATNAAALCESWLSMKARADSDGRRPWPRVRSDASWPARTFWLIWYE